LEIIKIKGKLFIYWLINDYKNKRWFELWVSGADETNARVKNFVESVKIENNPEGAEIESGSWSALGDANLPNKNDCTNEENNQTKSENNEVIPVRIIFRAYPKYTDAARQAQTKGTVSLRVTFLANGGIGNIEIISALPYGLTEQAIAAAKKMVFIPAKKNKVSCSVIKSVEYSFSIY
jgi:TonB family protein